MITWYDLVTELLNILSPNMYYTSFSTPILNLDYSKLRSCSNDNFVLNGLVGISKYTYRKYSYQKLCSYKNYINSIAFVFGS